MKKIYKILRYIFGILLLIFNICFVILSIGLSHGTYVFIGVLCTLLFSIGIVPCLYLLVMADEDDDYKLFNPIFGKLIQKIEDIKAEKEYKKIEKENKTKIIHTIYIRDKKTNNIIEIKYNKEPKIISYNIIKESSYKELEEFSKLFNDNFML